MYKIYLILSFFILFVNLRNVLGNDKIKEKQLIHHKTRQIKSDQHRQKIKERCWPSRCNIICPIPDSPIPESPSRRYPDTYFEQNSLFQPEYEPYDDLDPYDFYDDGYRNIKHSKPVLTKRQKHALLRQFRVGNENGKKAYKFRQFPPSGCYVRCNDYQQIPPGVTQGIISTPFPVTKPPVTLPSNNTNSEQDDDDDEDEPYQPGEDRPIEATFSPPEKKSHTLKGKLKEKKSHKQ